VSTPPESPPEHQHSSLSEKLARRREHHIQRSMPYRVAFTIAAFLITLAGLAAIPLPGPGWAIVFVGLGMLALEFKWAESLMAKILDRLEAAKKSASAASPLQKALMSAAVAVGIAAFAVAAILWDIPLVPVL
jgi:uncharacterized protein (TIGR02611 family)